MILYRSLLFIATAMNDKLSGVTVLNYKREAPYVQYFKLVFLKL